MPDQYTYLAVDFCCIIFPFIFSFFPQFNFYKQWRYFLLPCLGTALFFVLWDILFTYLGVWSFNPQYLIGVNIFGLPLEEYLFFICIPYACTFTYHCLNLFFKFPNPQWVKVFTLALISISLLVGVTHINQLYTSATFILLSIFLAVLLGRKVTYLSAFYISFLLILLPFFISNGILTGGIVGRTVVMYNNAHNLGIRMFTIPFEDTFYGMLLLIMNISGYEYMRSRKAASNP